jgi:hypothetical protein
MQCLGKLKFLLRRIREVKSGVDFGEVLTKPRGTPQYKGRKRLHGL